MSEERITLDLLGARLMALTAEVRDLQQRFDGLDARLSGLEGRFGAIERRFGVQEERMSRMLSLIVRIAERQGVGSDPT
ncbi:MAG TPA: hypothetical protein VFQ90_15655 [Stellaceae bacterium]|jgi:hypothetical protein|nr:hypothetical protein [Stellaceae bacterium]